jgi:large subunit ribosomal protein L18
MLEKQIKRYRRHRRVRAKVKGTAKVPRLCVFRSASHIYAQLIDDEKGKVIASVNDFKVVLPKKESKSPKGPDARTEGKDESAKSGKVAIAYEIGKIIAQKAVEKKIKKVIFDRGGYKYHGRVKALADGARDGGLEF